MFDDLPISRTPPASRGCAPPIPGEGGREDGGRSPRRHRHPEGPRPGAPRADPSVGQLAAEYIDYADTYYVRDGRPTAEANNTRLALELACELYGHTPAREFGPLRLQAVRGAMIDSGLCRNEINRRIQRIVRAFRWAASRELIPVSNYLALTVVAPLRPGEASARESRRVGPVADAHVDAIRPFVSRQVWAMVELQRLTGMRPGEARAMRTCDVDTSGPVWLYTPRAHKMAIHGHERRIHLGPRAQEVLRPWLRADPEAPLFQPREAAAARWVGRRRGPGPPAWSRPPRRAGPAVAPGETYSAQSYLGAIRKAIAKANRSAEASGGARIPHWGPHQLRHAAATRLRREFGLSVAKAVLGHRSLATSIIYAELDRGKAADAMARIG